MYKTYHYNNMPVMRSSPQRHESVQPENTKKNEPVPDRAREHRQEHDNEREKKHEHEHDNEREKKHEQSIKPDHDGGGIIHDFFGGLKNDDIILLVIIFILLLDDCEDKLLLTALGFIFFSGLGFKD